MMSDKERQTSLEYLLRNQWMKQSPPPTGLLEQRVLELEGMGLVDAEEMPGLPSSMRQFAIASLQHSKPEFFITYDDELLTRRDKLESRYGLMILSVHEAMLLLRDGKEPPD